MLLATHKIRKSLVTNSVVTDNILDENVSEWCCVDIELSGPGLQDKTERNNPLHVVTTATSQPPPIGIELNDLVTGGLLAAPGLTTAVHPTLNDQ